MKRLFCISLLCCLISGCGIPPFKPSQLSTISTVDLWGIIETSARNPRHSTDVYFLFAEAELASRGESKSSTRYLGQTTARYVGSPRYGRDELSSNSDTKNCADFNSSAEAQKYFILSGGPTADPHNLDGDGDGFACEWGTTIKQFAKTYRPKPIRATRYRPTCHTGPRGGRYYYSASGSKVYGC